MTRKAFLALHVQTLVTDPATGRQRRRLCYIGPWYAFDRAALRKRLPALWSLLAVSLAAFTVAGCIPAAGQRCMYVLPPYILTLLPLYFGLMATARLTRVKADKVDEMQRQEGVESLRHASLGLAVLPAAWLVGESVMLMLSGVHMDSEWWFFACAAAQTAAGLLFRTQARAIKVGEPLQTQ